MSIDNLLQPFQSFGIHLGLERIKNLLAKLGNPHHQVPIIHVTGTNGKGSVCAYLSSVLTAAGYQVGRYTSPHLIDWTERICLNEKPISSADLEQTLQQVIAAIEPDAESPTQFEVITAAAWLYFAQAQVDIAVIEVGLGGRLDATNVCASPLVTVITSLSREHWQRLGSSLAEIATEKAGILKPGCPAVIGKLPPQAQKVVNARIAELNCPAVWVEPAQELSHHDARWAKYTSPQGTISYPLPLLAQVQLTNSALAMACLQILQQQGWQITEPIIQAGMAKTRWRGRMEWVQWRNQKLLVDGAHNPGAAKALRQYVETFQQPVTWVMGMLATKDHEDIFRALLRPNDQLYLVPVPENKTPKLQDLAILAGEVCPDLAFCQTSEQLLIVLDMVMSQKQEKLVVLCGSLYLVGYFLAQID